MPISLDLSAVSAAEPRFAVSPLVELGWAWHVIVGLDHHPDRADWAADAWARVPDDLAAAMDSWSFAVRTVRSVLFVDPMFAPGDRWPGPLERVRQLPAANFQTGMLRPLLRSLGRSDELSDPRVRREILSLARARGAATTQVVRLILDDPAAARTGLVDVFERLWSAFFHTDWAQVGPALDREAHTRNQLAAGRGWAGAIRDISPAVAVSDDGRIVIDTIQSTRVEMSGRGLVLVPTAFGSPHVYVGDEPGRPVVVHYAYPPPAAAADRPLTVRRLGVLAHPARLEVCRAIAIEPRSAREIAPLWNVTEYAVTKHLAALRAVDLVRSERVGRFVRYSLTQSAIETLGSDLLDVLHR